MLAKKNLFMHDIKKLGQKRSSVICLKIEVQTESISEWTFKDLSNDIRHAYRSWKLVGDEENNIPPPLYFGGGIIKNDHKNQ